MIFPVYEKPTEEVLHLIFLDARVLPCTAYVLRPNLLASGDRSNRLSSVSINRKPETRGIQ
jgi:hypothetical protein